MSGLRGAFAGECSSTGRGRMLFSSDKSEIRGFQVMGRQPLVATTRHTTKRRIRGFAVVARLPFDPPLFDPNKLSVTYLEGGDAWTAPRLPLQPHNGATTVSIDNQLFGAEGNGNGNGAARGSRVNGFGNGNGNGNGSGGNGAPAARPPPRAAHPPRRSYTLTHNDITGTCQLSIGPDYNVDQISGWYTKLLRDEVLAEWRPSSDPSLPPASLHVHVHVSGTQQWPLAPPALRDMIFRREMSLVLDTFRYADQEFLTAHPELARAPVFVHFHSDYRAPQLNRVEPWGRLDDPSTWPEGLPPSSRPEPMIPLPAKVAAGGGAGGLDLESEVSSPEGEEEGGATRAAPASGAGAAGPGVRNGAGSSLGGMSGPSAFSVAAVGALRAMRGTGADTLQ